MTKRVEKSLYAPANTDNEVDLRLGGDVKVTRRTRSALQADLLLLLVDVFLNVGLRTLEDDLALSLRRLNVMVSICTHTNFMNEWSLSPERWLIQATQ